MQQANLSEVSQLARQLSALERGQLVEELIALGEDEPHPFAASWDAEIQRRVSEMESGKAVYIDAERVRAKALSIAP